MRLHVVGNGCPHPAPEAYGSAFVLEVGGEFVMVDCGPATTYKMARMGIRTTLIEHLFLTHLHFDHNADVPCFALTRWDQTTRGEVLKIYGPPPTRTFVERLLGAEGAFFDDWQSRITHPASEHCHMQRGGTLPRPAPAIEALDVGPGEVARTEAWTASATRVHHVEPTLESLAFRFDTGEGSIVFAGDCADCEELRALARGADTLVLACAYFDPYDAAVADVITGASEVGGIARDCGVGRLILSHASPGVAKPEGKARALAEAAKSYDGPVLFPDELTAVDL